MIGAGLPASVKLAAALLVGYGLAVVVSALAMAVGDGWDQAGGLPRAVIRLLAASVIAWGLLRRARWAWWLGLALAIVWLVMGASAMVVVEEGDLHWLRPSGYQSLTAAAFLCLGGVVASLLTGSARSVFRSPD